MNVPQVYDSTGLNSGNLRDVLYPRAEYIESQPR